MHIKVINHDWHTKPVTIKDKTKKVLTTGKVIPTWEAMLRKANK